MHRIDPLQDSRWPALLDRHPDVSVFHTPGWLEALRQTYGYRPVAFTDSSPTSELKNGLVFCQVRSRLTGCRLVSLPFSDHCEPLVDSADELDFLIRCLQADLEHSDWKYLEIRPINARFHRKNEEFSLRPAGWYYLYRLDLRPDLEKIRQGLHEDSVQQPIRDAESAGLVCECGRNEKLLRQFYSLLVLTRSSHDWPPQPYLWFQNLVRYMGDALEIRVAYYGHVPIAAVLNLRFRKTVYYRYGCANEKFNHQGAMPFLLWRTIVESKATGAEEFDLGVAKSHNDQRFISKNHWTEWRTKLAHWRYPAAEPTARRERWSLKLARQVFACVPDRLLQAAGRMIYQHIG